MGQLIADVAKDPSTKYSCCYVPIIEEYCIYELIERCCKSNEQNGRHGETILIHWKVVVDTMEEEMGCDTNAVIR